MGGEGGRAAGDGRSLDRRRFLKTSLAWTAGVALPSVGGELGARRAAADPAPAAGVEGGPSATVRRAPAGSAPRTRHRPRIAVVGAGAFGGWTALQLARRGAEVVLVDAWGAGNPRSSSGGETRVIRGVYGGDAVYTDWVARSFDLWRDAEREWDERLYRRTGVLWMFRGDDAYVRSARPALERHRLPLDEIDLAAARRRWPQVSFDGVRSVFFEHEAGHLAARRACRRVATAVTAAGGELRLAHAEPGTIAGGAMAPLRLAGGSALAADAYVFACGPWLGRLFPDLLGSAITPSRQEVFFFGLPAGEERFGDDRFPAWVDFGERVVYGIPGNLGRGFKLADDSRGEPVDPTTLDRVIGEEGLSRARRFLAERFPPLAGAPLVESRVCQYENSPDGHLVLDGHPDAANAWIAGGGSGHGFKLAPAVGEHVAGLVLGEAEPLPRFSIARLATDGGAPRTQMQTGGRPSGD